MLTVYHGSTLRVEYPLVNAGRANLDFGLGFYITRLRTQAERWGRQMKIRRSTAEAVVNIYKFDLLNQKLIDDYLCYIDCEILTDTIKKGGTP